MSARFFILLFCLVLSLFTVSCGADPAAVHYNGTALDEDGVREILEQIKEAETVDAESSTETELTLPQEVYWTANGTVWHADKSCGHISKKQELQFGSLEDAALAGKERGCSFCTE